MEKVLLFCPLNPIKDGNGTRKPQIFGRTNESIFRQDYPILDIWFSKGDNPWFDSNGRHNIAHNYNKARRWMLDNDYDYLFTVEADMIIPPNALTRLLDVCENQGADVAYGLYCFKNTSTWSAWTYLDMKGGRSIRKDPDLAKASWGEVIDVAGVGMGCTLIKRSTMEALEFRTDETNPDVHNDWVFAYDLQQKGLVQKCDLGVVCGHISMTPLPRVIWPDPESPRLYRNDFIEKIETNDRGEVIIDVGQLGEFEITVGDLLRKGRSPKEGE
jgi:hypothetical protein